jgi:thiol-disulfide isomerase/thioredoxin
MAMILMSWEAPAHNSRPLAALRRLALVALLAGAPGVFAQPLDFLLSGLDGTPHRLSDHRGKWVVVNYWATWCPPCRKEMPELEQFYQADPMHAVVLGVNMEDVDETRLREFVDHYELTFPILLAGPRPRQTELVGPVEGLPTTYLVAPSGRVVARQIGGVTAEGLHTFIERFTKQQGGGRP